MPLQRSRVHVNGMPLLSYQNNLLHFLSCQCVQRYIVIAREGVHVKRIILSIMGFSCLLVTTRPT